MWKLLLPLLLLAGMVGLTVLSDRPRPRADLTFINRGDVNTLDLHRMSWMQDIRVASALFEGLVVVDVFSHELAIKPGIAERWDVSPDGLTYTFFLRPNAKWSNGQPLTARDIVRSYFRATLPETAGDYITLYELINGVKAFGQWRRDQLAEFARTAPADPPARKAAADKLLADARDQFERSVGLQAVDDRTLRVTLERQTPYFLQVMAYEIMAPLYMPLVEQYQEVDPATGRLVLESGWTKPGVLVSNGPYLLAEFRFKRDMRLEANPHYWNAAQVKLRSIAIPSVSDPNAAVLAFKGGGIDWLSDVVADYRRDLWREKKQFYAEHRAEYERLLAQGLDPVAIDRRLPKDPRKTIHAFPAFGTYFFNFNCSPRFNDGTPNPFADPRVRRAFAMAVDKQAISDIRGLDEPVINSLIPPGTLFGYTPPKGLSYDPAAARALLADAGFPGGRGLPVIRILFNKDGGHDVVSQSIAKDWQRELGVQVVLDQRELKTFREDLKSHNFMISRAGWFGDYADPTTFLDLSRSGDGNNDRNYSDPVFDALLDQAANTSDPAARYRILERAERHLMEEGPPMIPLIQYRQMFMFDPHRVSGVSPHPLQKQKLSALAILGDGVGPDDDRPLEMPVRPPRGTATGSAVESGRAGGAESSGGGR